MTDTIQYPKRSLFRVTKSDRKIEVFPVPSSPMSDPRQTLQRENDRLRYLF
ncbi:MAG: hypothetical protein ACOYME_10425 [Prochlorotrichaceae cyanobacterium]